MYETAALSHSVLSRASPAAGGAPTLASSGQCPGPARPIIVPPSAVSQAGLGNRLGWSFSFAALARTLNSSVYIPWSTLVHGYQDPGVPHDYNLTEVMRLMSLPANLHFIECDSLVQKRKCLLHSSARHQPSQDKEATPPKAFNLEFVHDFATGCSGAYYVPDVFWKLLAALSERHSRKGSGGMQTDLLPCPNATRDGFLGAYKSTQAEVQPRVDLQNPTPRTYMALHVRRRLRFTDELLNSTRVAIGSIFRANGLPWLILAQSAAMAEGARRSLLAIGVRIVDRSVVGGMSMEQELLRGALQFPCPAALACTRTHTHNTRARIPDFPCSLRARLQPAPPSDFFAISAAAGVLVDIRWSNGTAVGSRRPGSWQCWVDSSLSSVAAFTGGAPLLIAYPRNFCNGKTSVADWRAHVPVRNATMSSALRRTFFVDESSAFLASVNELRSGVRVSSTQFLE